MFRNTWQSTDVWRAQTLSGAQLPSRRLWHFALNIWGHQRGKGGTLGAVCDTQKRTSSAQGQRRGVQPSSEIRHRADPAPVTPHSSVWAHIATCPRPHRSPGSGTPWKYLPDGLTRAPDCVRRSGEVEGTGRSKGHAGTPCWGRSHRGSRRHRDTAGSLTKAEGHAGGAKGRITQPVTHWTQKRGYKKERGLLRVGKSQRRWSGGCSVP